MVKKTHQLPATRGHLDATAKPPKVKARPKLFIREEDIPRLRILTRAGELVEIELLCGDGEKQSLSADKQ